MIDKRLTAAEKKKIKPVNQGGGPNYLGKQEMVTAPKKWLSDPDHVVAELAYITPKEKEILIKADIYGSLKGTPNKGPSGIQSLQGDLGGYDASPGGPDSGDTGGPVGSDEDTVQQQKQKIKDILTGKTVTGQTAAKGPRTKQYSDLPEYMKVLQDDGTYKDTYVGSAYKSYGTPSFFGNLFSRGAPGYRGIQGLSAFGDPMKNYKVDMGGPAGPGYYTDKTNFTEMNPAMPQIGILGILNNLSQKFKQPKDMSEYNKLGLYADRFPTGFGIPTQQGDYDVLGNKINEITGEIVSPTGDSLGFIDGYPGGGDGGGITTIPTGGNNDYTQNLVETINETTDDNVPGENLLLRYLGLDSTLDPEAAGVNSVAELRDLQTQRAKNIFTT
jgi:hypothetical protein